MKKAFRVIVDKWFIALFFISMSIPAYGNLLDKNIVMSGIVQDTEEVAISAESIGDGTYQTFLNDRWEKGFPGRKALLRIRNTIMYFAHVSPNSNVVIGKDRYLFVPDYILKETQIHAPATEEYFAELEYKLSTLDDLMDTSGKELYVFISPSKARFFKDKIPVSYMALNAEDDFSYTNYSKLLEILQNDDIKYFDSIEYIENHIQDSEFQSPVFYPTGIHWSRCWGGKCTTEFLKYMNDTSKYDLSLLEIGEYESEEPIYPDSDLYDLLDLMIPAKQKWYGAYFSTVKEGDDKPSVFLRGGSFMGQSLGALISNGVFDKNVHFENNYYFTDYFSTQEFISSFRSYEEMDLKALIGPSDIVILEVNEAAIADMSWGFIDYLLEHPQYLEE